MGFMEDALAAAKASYTAPKTATTSLQTAKKSVPAISKATGSVTGSAGATTAPASTAYTGAKTELSAAAPVATAPAPTAAPAGPTNDVPVVSEKADEAVVASADPSGEFNDTLSRFTEDDISAALAAIEAEFGLTREELLRDQTMIGAQYRLLTAQLARQREKALGQAEAGALQRGLFRSGIYAAEVGEVATEFADKQAEFRTAADSQQLAIEQRLATLDAEKAQAKATEETAIRRGEYTARLQAAGL